MCSVISIPSKNFLVIQSTMYSDVQWPIWGTMKSFHLRSIRPSSQKYTFSLIRMYLFISRLWLRWWGNLWGHFRSELCLNSQKNRTWAILRVLLSNVINIMDWGLSAGCCRRSKGSWLSLSRFHNVIGAGIVKDKCRKVLVAGQFYLYRLVGFESSPFAGYNAAKGRSPPGSKSSGKHNH